MRKLARVFTARAHRECVHMCAHLHALLCTHSLCVQARRKQLRIGGGTHNFFFLNYFFFLGGGGIFVQIIGGGMAPPRAPPPIPTALVYEQLRLWPVCACLYTHAHTGQHKELI